MTGKLAATDNGQLGFDIHELDRQSDFGDQKSRNLVGKSTPVAMSLRKDAMESRKASSSDATLRFHSHRDLNVRDRMPMEDAVGRTCIRVPIFLLVLSNFTAARPLQLQIIAAAERL